MQITLKSEIDPACDFPHEQFDKHIEDGDGCFHGLPESFFEKRQGDKIALKSDIASRLNWEILSHAGKRLLIRSEPTLLEYGKETYNINPGFWTAWVTQNDVKTPLKLP